MRQRFAVGTVDALVVIFDVRTATKWRVLEGHEGAINAITFDGAGQRLASFSAQVALARGCGRYPSPLSLSLSLSLSRARSRLTRLSAQVAAVWLFTWSWPVFLTHTRARAHTHTGGPRAVLGHRQLRPLRALFQQSWALCPAGASRCLWSCVWAQSFIGAKYRCSRL
jgi:hypothetical protein